MRAPLVGIPDAPVSLLEATPWQMALGERAAFEGLLAQVRPALAIEIGTAQGGSLERLAAYSEEVHAFDLLELDLPVAREPRVHRHIGDSHELLPRVLAEFAGAGRNVDFVLVDGDHSADGVRRDVEDLLASAAVQRTVVVLHDAANEFVRAGLEQVDFTSWAKVVHVDLDFVAGAVYRDEALHHEIWGGLGLVVVDAAGGAGMREDGQQDRVFESARLLRTARDLFADGGPGELARLREQLAGRKAEEARLRTERDAARLEARVAAGRLETLRTRIVVRAALALARLRPGARA